jgi:hypothetical protein
MFIGTNTLTSKLPQQMFYNNNPESELGPFEISFSETRLKSASSPAPRVIPFLSFFFFLFSLFSFLSFLSSLFFPRICSQPPLDLASLIAQHSSPAKPT